MICRAAIASAKQSAAVQLLGNYRLQMDGVGEYSITTTPTGISWDVVTEDPSGLLVSGATTITAPTGSVYCIVTGHTRDNNSGTVFTAIVLFKNGGFTPMTQQNHNGDYSTHIIGGVVPCIAGDTFQLAAWGGGTNSDLQQDSRFSVAFYG